MEEWRPFGNLSGVDTIIAAIDDHQAGLSSEELAIVASSAESRVREFTAGRSLARFVLRRFGVDAPNIMPGFGGQPIWPDGITGSISHTNRQVAVAIARRTTYRAIGIDIESPQEFNAEDVNLVLTSAEQSRFPGIPPADDVAALFCSKEAAFKAVFPITEVAFEFTDVEVDLVDGEFVVHMRKPSPAAALLASGRGFTEMRGNIVASIFCID